MQCSVERDSACSNPGPETASERRRRHNFGKMFATVVPPAPPARCLWARVDAPAVPVCAAFDELNARVLCFVCCVWSRSPTRGILLH